MFVKSDEIIFSLKRHMHCSTIHHLTAKIKGPVYDYRWNKSLDSSEYTSKWVLDCDMG